MTRCVTGKGGNCEVNFDIGKNRSQNAASLPIPATIPQEKRNSKNPPTLSLTERPSGFSEEKNTVLPPFKRHKTGSLRKNIQEKR
jgi:hypothetical protein